MGSHAARARKNREVLPGYPKDFVFETPEQIEEYFNHVEITCLLCGQNKRSLGVHLRRMHGMEPDEYKELYGLPWRRGLVGTVTRKYKADQARQFCELGIFQSTPENREKAMEAQKNQRKRQPFRKELVSRSLDIMNAGKDGAEAERRKNAPKRGTKEFSEMMRSRPQTANPSEEFVFWWVGKQQSDDHVFRRTGYWPKKRG